MLPVWHDKSGHMCLNSDTQGDQNSDENSFYAHHCKVSQDPVALAPDRAPEGYEEERRRSSDENAHWRVVCFAAT